MIRQLVHDPIFLAMKSAPATKDDLPAAKDLLDTLIAHREDCVGMAANMIGVSKRIIVFNNNGMFMTMLNPEITAKSGPYDTEEGCLSLSGQRRTKRYNMIEVEYQDLNMKKQRRTFAGFTAQIIQHEIDHCDGILI